MLTLGHDHPELVQVVAEQTGLSTHGLDSPMPPEDASTEARPSMLPPSMRDCMRIRCCGPTGAIPYERGESGPGVDMSTRRPRRHGRQGPWSWAVRTTPYV